jgi:hypothetical protein
MCWACSWVRSWSSCSQSGAFKGLRTWTRTTKGHVVSANNLKKDTAFLSSKVTHAWPQRPRPPCVALLFSSLSSAETKEGRRKTKTGGTVVVSRRPAWVFCDSISSFHHGNHFSPLEAHLRSLVSTLWILTARSKVTAATPFEIQNLDSLSLVLES